MTTPQQKARLDNQPDEDIRILQQSRADPAAFAPLYERYFPRIYAYCLRRVGTTEEAEDLTSLVFTRALTGLANYRGGSVAAWLFRIAHNAIANYLRDRRPQLSLETTAITTPEPLSDTGDQTLERLMQAEEYSLMTHLIAMLPDQQREILTLTVIGELSAKEVGAVVGKSEGAVWVALHRIIQGLRARYSQTEGELRQ